MLIALGLAVATTLVVLGVGVVSRAPQVVGNQAPAIASTTLDGAPFDLTSLRGRPVIVNFWGPNCAPCREEFPLFKTKLAAHSADGLEIVGVLMYDGPDDAKAFIAHYGATWPTVLDTKGAIRTAYRVAARPQTYFIDRSGVVRKIQVGQVTETDFDSDYALISGPG